VNSALINMGVQVCLLCDDLHSLDYMPKSVTAGSHVSSNFSFLMNLHTDFHNGYINLHSHQYYMLKCTFPQFFYLIPILDRTLKL
jgi:hypothetical protein